MGRPFIETGQVRFGYRANYDRVFDNTICYRETRGYWDKDESTTNCKNECGRTENFILQEAWEEYLKAFHPDLKINKTLKPRILQTEMPIDRGEVEYWTIRSHVIWGYKLRNIRARLVRRRSLKTGNVLYRRTFAFPRHFKSIITDFVARFQISRGKMVDFVMEKVEGQSKPVRIVKGISEWVLEGKIDAEKLKKTKDYIKSDLKLEVGAELF